MISGVPPFQETSSCWLVSKFQTFLFSIHGMVELMDNSAKGHWYALRRGKAWELIPKCKVDKLISVVYLEVWYLSFCTLSPVVENENSGFSRSLLSPGPNMQHVYAADGVPECGTTANPKNWDP